jgi:glucose/arabinose dehydrogenase
MKVNWLVLTGVMIFGLVVLFIFSRYILRNIKPDNPPDLVGGTWSGEVLEKESDIANIEVPEGFVIRYYSGEVPGARSMTMGRDGVIYVGTRDEGKVYAVINNNKDNEADQVLTIASGLELPNGVAYHEGDLYVAEIGRIIKFSNIDGKLGERLSYEVVTDIYPQEETHGWKYIDIGPDNKIYVPVGAPCNICDPENSIYASITRINLDGSGLEIVASGVRNSVGFDWDRRTGKLWFTDNGRDWMGDNLPGDELNVLDQVGEDFGFPYCHAENISDPIFGSLISCNVFENPSLVMPAHVAALGIAFYEKEQFPSEYNNNVFIAEHGSWNRSEPIGYRVTRATIDGDNASNYSVFAEGWLRDGEAWGRPVDILVLEDGSILVSDDFRGAIYRISYEG